MDIRKICNNIEYYRDCKNAKRKIYMYLKKVIREIEDENGLDRLKISFSTHTANALKNNLIWTQEELMETGLSSLFLMKGLGKQSIEEIKKWKETVFLF